MTEIYKLEVTPDHKKLGLKMLLGHATAYFDSIPTKAKALKVFMRSKKHRITRFERKFMDAETASETQRENLIFYKAVESIVKEVDVSEDAFKTPKWSEAELKEFSPEERSIAAISIGAKNGRFYISRIRVWSAK
jgi:hypothetical protein